VESATHAEIKDKWFGVVKLHYLRIGTPKASEETNNLCQKWKHIDFTKLNTMCWCKKIVTFSSNVKKLLVLGHMISLAPDSLHGARSYQNLF
jgi:hypothetical protein